MTKPDKQETANNMSKYLTETRDITRRGCIKRSSIAGLGFSIFGSQGTTNGMTEIVTHQSNDTPRMTKLVPTEWYEQKQDAVDGKDQLFDRYEDAGGIHGVGVKAGETEVDGYRYFNVVVHID